MVLLAQWVKIHLLLTTQLFAIFIKLFPSDVIINVSLSMGWSFDNLPLKYVKHQRSG